MWEVAWLVICSGCIVIIFYSCIQCLSNADARGGVHTGLELEDELTHPRQIMMYTVKIDCRMGFSLLYSPPFRPPSGHTRRAFY